MRFLLIYIVLIPFFCFSGGIEKGYDALKVYNYFEAKNQFEKNLKKDSLACAYGLSIIHFRQDNPFHNKQYAFQYFEIVWNNFKTDNEKDKAYWNKLGINKETIDTLRNLISAHYFIESENKGDYHWFLANLDWANEYDSAFYLQDKINFNQAKSVDTRESYQKFIGFYPESAFIDRAQKRYHSRLFEEQTNSATVLSYKRFIQNFPNSPFKEEAEDKIYELFTSAISVEGYKEFIDSYPNNRNVFDAWRRLYKEYMIDFSEQRYTSFQEEYPDYPFMGELQIEFELSRVEFLPFQRYEKWGFIDTLGFVRIEAKYESVEKFREGIAIVVKDGKYGAINKKGKLIVEPIYDEMYDFHEGVAVVGQGDFYGMINGLGETVLKIEYDDVTDMKNGLTKAEKDGLIGFYDKNGFMKIEAVYDDADDFENGMAIVSKDGYYGIIDRFGVVVLDFNYDDLFYFNDNLIAAETGMGWGIITAELDTILDFEMDLIRPLKNGFSYFELDDEYGFLNENGRIVIEASYDVFADDKQLCEFKNGHALIRHRNKLGLIDEKGKKIIPTIFTGIGQFDALIPITKGDLWGYCDEKANRKIDYQFEYASNFKGDYAVVQLNQKMGLINKKGEFALPSEYDEILILDNGFIKIKKGERFGLLDPDLKQVIPTQADELKFFSDVLIAVYEAGETNYFSLRSNTYIEIE